MTGKKHKAAPGWALGKGLSKKSNGPPRTPEGYLIIPCITKSVSELNEPELKKMENALAREQELGEELEQEKLKEFEKGTSDEDEEAKSYLWEVCWRRLTPLQKKVLKRVWEEDKTDGQIAKELGISKGNVSTIRKQINNKFRKLLTRKFLKKNYPAKGSPDNK